jgi:betaine lipid synthase
MLAACAARLQDMSEMTWVDLGGGTGANVELMSHYIDLAQFKHIYIVDLCASLCAQARLKVAENGWTNVTVVEGDACEFAPPGGATATLVTFSYSLSSALCRAVRSPRLAYMQRAVRNASLCVSLSSGSLSLSPLPAPRPPRCPLAVIPPFHAAVDRAVSYLDREEGLLGVADFGVSAKYDLPLRQQPWARRFFWRAVFDTDNIDLGPERRQYLDHALSRVWEFNDEGSIPYVPLLRAPYYVAVYRVPKLETMLVESKVRRPPARPLPPPPCASAAVGLGGFLTPAPPVRLSPQVEAPPMFPPTFLYTQSWEDPAADAPHLQVGPADVCLTLTSGGCNSLALCLAGARAVYSVDCNPAQNALLELKQVAIRQLPHDDVWRLFGEGRHPRAAQLFERHLAPFLTQSALRFWRPRMHYFRDGLYFQGGMGKVVWCMQVLAGLLGCGKAVRTLAVAPTLEAQRKIFDSMWPVRLLRTAPAPLLSLISDAASLLLFNRVTLWFGAGVPLKQYQLITGDGMHMSNYVARTFDGVAQNSHLAKDNYFYLNCLTGAFSRSNCPDYLSPRGFASLRSGAVDALHIVNNFFLPTLEARTYTRVILMDHLDWLDEPAARQVAAALGRRVAPGGRVIWRSAALAPPYSRWIEEAGFEVRCLQRADEGYMDRVNSYASFFVAVKK